MIELEAGRLVIKVPLTIANARAMLDAGCSVFQPGEQIVDFSEVSEADSSAIAVMLGWLRGASASRSSLKFAQVPLGVRSLAELYGVTELLPLV